eukprot:345988-Pyramimonas_sp.AAC.1
MRVLHFLKLSRPTNYYYIELSRPLATLDDTLRKRIPVPECLDVSKLSDDFIDFEMLSAAIDFGTANISSELDGFPEEHRLWHQNA